MNYNIIIKNAITISLIYIILKLLAFVIGIEMKSSTDWGIFAITLGAFIYFGKLYSQNIVSVESNLVDILLHGFITSLIFIAIIALFTVIYVKFIDVNFYKKIFDMAAEEMKNYKADEKMKEMMELSKQYMTIPYLLLSTFFSNIIMCNIGNLIGAFIFRNNK